MSSVENRLKRYFLARLRREAIRSLYRRAERAGLMEGRFIEKMDDRSGRVWKVTGTGARAIRADMARAASHANGTGLDVSRLERALRRGGDGEARITFTLEDEGIVTNNVHSISKGQLAMTKGEGAASVSDDGKHQEAPGLGGGTLDDPGDSSDLLRAIRSHAQRPHVADAAVALLIANAVGNAVPDIETFAAILRRPNPCVVIRIAVPSFERLCGRMIERGLLMPFSVTLVDGLPGQRITESYRDNPADPSRVIVFAGKTMAEKSENSIRENLTKSLFHAAMPTLILDETVGRDLPLRIAACADLIAAGIHGIGRELVVELMDICLGINPAVSNPVMDELVFSPSHLGIDDLVVAIRPGRSAAAIVEALHKLDMANRTQSTAEEQDEEKDAYGKRSSPTSKTNSKKKAETTFELVQPIQPLPDKDVSVPSGKAGGTPVGRDRVLLIEELAGYGEAQVWALDLKTDLTLWREGLLEWSDMSTKLLLSGPPGTGKTTFAKALCNSLQVPMLATSVAQWLEPGYLGDVLKLMSSAFETAGKHKPAILFIDEIDGIGRRGSSRSYAEYWDSVVNRALELLDGTAKSEGVIVVGATNHPEKIDPALRRSGRLERHVAVPLPDSAALVGILSHHLGRDLPNVIESRPTTQSMQKPTGKSAGAPGQPLGSAISASALTTKNKKGTRA